jgi:hypothetical protein
MLVKTVTGMTDFLFQGARGAVYAIQDGRTASGDFAFVRRDAQGVVLAHLVGGTELQDGDFVIRSDRAGYSGSAGVPLHVPSRLLQRNDARQ